ncbi:hypothetical protein HWV62_7254 [Athelia sp. TMB]|nr:hypothetical protein HWV62_25312 [Athelia sp. TMB]KAF7976229.1 hypothetical protein HWV62_7254 [Athelia sp. TMB]
MDPNTKYSYFMQDGWIWLVHPRQRLCWVPVTSRGTDGGKFMSSKTRIAIDTGDRGVMVIDFTGIITSEK